MGDDLKKVKPADVRRGSYGLSRTPCLSSVPKPVRERAARPGAAGPDPSAFRHTFASRPAQAGVSLYKLAQWMGHSDLRTTEIYAHLQAGCDEEIEKAAPMGTGLDQASKGDEQ